MLEYVPDLSEEQIAFGYLYSSLPTAPGAYVIAASFGVYAERIAGALVLCTLVSAPLLFVSTILLSSSADDAPVVPDAATIVGLVSAVAASLLLVGFVGSATRRACCAFSVDAESELRGHVRCSVGAQCARACGRACPAARGIAAAPTVALDRGADALLASDADLLAAMSGATGADDADDVIDAGRVRAESERESRSVCSFVLLIYSFGCSYSFVAHRLSLISRRLSELTAFTPSNRPVGTRDAESSCCGVTRKWLCVRRVCMWPSYPLAAVLAMLCIIHAPVHYGCHRAFEHALVDVMSSQTTPPSFIVVLSAVQFTDVFRAVWLILISLRLLFRELRCSGECGRRCGMIERGFRYPGNGLACTELWLYLALAAIPAAISAVISAVVLSTDDGWKHSIYPCDVSCVQVLRSVFRSPLLAIRHALVLTSILHGYIHPRGNA